MTERVIELNSLHLKNMTEQQKYLFKIKNRDCLNDIFIKRFDE